MFSEAKARRVTQFIECLKHTKGEFHGEPFKLLPWQEKIIRDVFGTVRDDDPSMRQYNTAYIEIPKKNGKSELGAAIALNMLCNDDEWRAEVYSCASDRQQAAIVFDVAADMVRQDRTLSKIIKIIPSTKRMIYAKTGSIYQVLSSEVSTKHGLNVSACIFDELHTQPSIAFPRSKIHHKGVNQNEKSLHRAVPCAGQAPGQRQRRAHVLLRHQRLWEIRHRADGHSAFHGVRLRPGYLGDGGQPAAGRV